MSEVIIGTKPLDEDRDYNSISIAPSATETVVISRRVRGGRKIRLAVLGNAVSSGGDANITWRLKRNGVSVRGFEAFQVMITDPARPDVLPIPIPLDQFDLIELVASNSDGSNAYVATGRIHVWYEEIPS